MQAITITLITTLVGFLVGVVAQLCLDPPTGTNKRSSYAKAFLYGFIGGALGTMISTSIMSLQSLAAVAHTLEHESPYDQASQFVAHLPDQDSRDLFGIGMRTIDHRLDLVRSGQILIDRDEVFQIWEDLFRRARHEVLATNLVSSGDWEFFGPGGSGRRIQQDAEKRGVHIVRIMLYDQKLAGHLEGLRKVACLHQQVGIDVRELPLGVLENPTYTGWLEKLRTSDIVLYDNRYLLLTHTYDRDQTIRWSLLTIDSSLREAAVQFYDRLSREAVPIPACSSASPFPGRSK